MKILSRIVLFAIVLQSFLPSFLINAQTPARAAAASTKTKRVQTRSAQSASVSAAYAAQLTLFEDFTHRQMALDQTPGLTIGFMKDDFVWVKGYGFADLENRSPAKAESAYRLASVTKPMTAVAVLQLVEKGKIDLDAEVQTYVPYFPKKQWPVTVRQVLGHLGGISHYKNYEQEGHFKDHKSTRQAVGVFENFDLIAEPGTRYSYSSYGYNLLGAVIEAASGMSYADYMRQNVWQPLGMTDTRMDDPFDVIPNRVRGYQLVDGKVKNSEFIDVSSRFAAGGTRSTVPDLLKFAKGIMDGKLISSDSTNMMSSSMSTSAGRLTNYGMGWETTPYSGRYMLVHSGGQQETRTLLYIIPSRRLAIAVGVNFEGANPGVYVERLFQLLTGSPLYLNVYSADKLKAAAADAVKNTSDYGLSSFEHYQKPLTASEIELKEAFAYFNDNVSAEAFKANAQEAMKKVREGVHPAAKQAFTKVGSYMAQRLQEKNGAASMQTYAGRGGLAFFEDYIALTNLDQNIPAAYRFTQPFATLVSEMARDWKKSNTEYVRQLWLMPDADLDAVAKSLRQSFAGANVYPSLVDDFFNITRQFVLKGERQRALKSSQLALEFYPESVEANFLRGIALIVNHDSAGGEAALKKAAILNPNPNALPSPGGLNNVAYQLAGVGRLDEALAIISSAVVLYPQDANLYDSLGEFQLKKGEKAKALESYKKALETNPKFPNATAAQEIVKKLTAELGGK